MVEQESELHATSIQDALVALSRLVLARSVTENGKGQHGSSNVIEASACLTGEGSRAGGQIFDILVGHAV